MYITTRDIILPNGKVFHHNSKKITVVMDSTFNGSDLVLIGIMSKLNNILFTNSKEDMDLRINGAEKLKQLIERDYHQ